MEMTDLQVPCTPVLLLERVNLEIDSLHLIALAKHLHGAKLVAERLNQRLARWAVKELLQEFVGDLVS